MCGEQENEVKKRRKQRGQRQRRAALRQTLEACVTVVTAVGEKERKNTKGKRPMSATRLGPLEALRAAITEEVTDTMVLMFSLFSTLFFAITLTL